jgi:hypothetical protein
MDNIELDFYRIMMGYFVCTIEEQEYKVINPTVNILYKAEQIKHQCINVNRYESWSTDQQNKWFLIKHGLVEPDIDQNLKEIDKRIDDLKVELYNKAFQVSEHDQLKKTLQMVKDKSNDMWKMRHMFDHTTVVGYANLVKHQFIIFNTLYYPDDTRVFDNFDIADFRIIDKIIQEVYRSSITEAQFRYIARHEPWRSIWSADKSNPYGKPSIDLTNEQRQLILMSKMYDAASEHPECPPDNIIEDDDMFDGWMIKHRRDRDRQQKVDTMDDILGGKHGDAHEVYIPAKTKQDIEQIEMLNDTEAKIIKAQRSKQIQNKGRVSQLNLHDERMRMQIEAQSQFRDKVKGSK